MNRAVALLCAAVATPLFSAPNIKDVSVSRQSFSPALRQSVDVSFVTNEAGTLNVVVVDRDGRPARRLPSVASSVAGPQRFTWDGRDDAGLIVPDEAWSFRIELASATGRAVYFPADAPQTPVDVGGVTYDRNSGVVSYRLPLPCRVHLQAGSAVVRAGASPDGPVLRTVVNREPRVAGTVVEQWNGSDESGTIYVPDLPNFVVSLAATALPENSVITTGNRDRTFLGAAATNSAASLFSTRGGGHAHHRGLPAVADVSPPLTLQPENATRDERRPVWAVRGPAMRVAVRVGGPAPTAFVAQHGALHVFVDGRQVQKISNVRDTFATLSLPVAGLSQGVHVLAVNWASPDGPVAVNALKFEVAGADADRSR